jgi:hypothetical protein
MLGRTQQAAHDNCYEYVRGFHGGFPRSTEPDCQGIQYFYGNEYCYVWILLLAPHRKVPNRDTNTIISKIKSTHDRGGSVLLFQGSDMLAILFFLHFNVPGIGMTRCYQMYTGNTICYVMMTITVLGNVNHASAPVGLLPKRPTTHAPPSSREPPSASRAQRRHCTNGTYVRKRNHTVV